MSIMSQGLSARSLPIDGTVYRCCPFVVAAVGIWSKVWLNWLNRVKHVNMTAFLDALNQKRPLVTVSNHDSFIDDPLIWGLLHCRYFFRDSKRLRWALAAEDVLFTRPLYRRLFAAGRCVPVVRGAGVYQPGMDFSVDALNKGGWVHIFPQGKVNHVGSRIRLKWGVGRLVAECDVCPAVLPLWFIGTRDVLPPNKKPYFPRVNKRVTVVFGNVIEFDSLVADMKEKGLSPEARKAVTDVVEQRLYALQDTAKAEHDSWL